MNRLIYIDNLLEKQKQRYTSLDIEVYTPQDIFEIELEDSDVLVVICELNIDKKGNSINRTEFYGITLVQELRRNKFMGRVLFVSFMSRKDLTDFSAKNEIINTVGHSFLQLPVNPTKWFDHVKRIQKLTALSINDIILNYCDNHGIINGIKHDINSKKEPTDKYRDSLIASIKKICSLYEDIKPDKVLNKFKTRYPSLTEGNLNKAVDFVVRFGNDIIAEKPTENSTQIALSKPFDHWKVILLDDEINEDDILYKTMSLNGLTVLLANTVEEAELYWEKDKKLNHPEIMVVLVDYRLNEQIEGVSVHQKKQGYDFLKQVSSSGRLIKTIVLSSMQKAFLLKSFNEYDISCEIITKSVVDINTENGANFIFEEVIRLGNENWSRIINLPNNASWEDLKPSYIQIVQSSRYESIEKEISDKANKWIENYKNGIINDDFGAKSTYSPKTNDEILTHLNIEKLIFTNYRKATEFFINHPELINEKLTKPDIKRIKKSRAIIENAFKQVKKTILNEFNSIESSILQADNYLETNIDNAILQFMGRRIAIWLVHKEKKNNVEISKLLKNKKSFTIGNAKQLVIKGLAISTNNIKNSITIEEQKWCVEQQYEYFSEWETNTIKEEQIIQEKLKVFKNIVSDYVEASDFIKKHISKNITIGLLNRVEYRIIYIDGKLQIESFKELKAHIKAFNSILTEKHSDNYESDLKEFILLIKKLLKEIKDITISDIKSMRYFLNHLHNPLFDDKKYKDKRYSSFNTKENRLNEYIRKFEPWVYFKKKYADNKEFFKEIKEFSLCAAKQELPSKFNNNIAFFGESFIKKENNRVVIEFYYMPYHYIWETSKHDILSLNESIYYGIILWKEKRIEYYDFKEKISKSKLTEIDYANIEKGKKYDPFDCQEEVDYYDDDIFSNIDSNIDVESL